jgi:hypothetical protein
MVQMYDHRAADVVMHESNLHRAAQPESIPPEEKGSPERFPMAQYFVRKDKTRVNPYEWTLGFKDITSATNMRTMIAAIVPTTAAGNTLPLLLDLSPDATCLLLANFNSLAFDYIARQKAQTTHLNWYILEQLPVIAPAAFEAEIGGVKIADFIREQVLRLSYTAHDLAPFARDLGFVGEPFPWDAEERQERMAALDALFMYLYGLSVEEARYILESFPIVREQDIAACGEYRTQNRIIKGLEELFAGQLPSFATGFHRLGQETQCDEAESLSNHGGSAR